MGMRRTTMHAHTAKRATTIAIVTILAIAASACGDEDDDGEAAGDAASADTTAQSTVPAEPCEPFGSLVVVDLNDRCSPMEDDPWDELKMLDLWYESRCDRMVAVPNQLIVAVGPGLDLGQEVADVIFQLGVEGLTGDPIAGIGSGGQAHLLSVDGNVGQVLDALPRLQGVGRSVDLNYLEPIQPNHGFRPADDPHEATDPGPTGDLVNTSTVFVIDSPSSSEIEYDTEANGLVDEDHGHGPFVASIIQRYVQSVELIGVMPGSPELTPYPIRLANDRWSPMMFSDAELIVALESAVEAGFINMSLGGVGCADQAVGERLALARVMHNMIMLNADLRFVAAAGNDGLDLLHFPAALRSGVVTNTMRDTIDAITGLEDDQGQPIDTGPIAGDLDDMHLALIPKIDAVGSIEANLDTSLYSNCGNWVNAAAYGSAQIGVYDASPSGYASWSGTSFATANYTAALVTGVVGSEGSPAPDTGAFKFEEPAQFEEPEGLDCP
jgi:hypothetical protein